MAKRETIPLFPSPPSEAKDQGEKKRKVRFAIGLLDFSKKRGGAERYLVDLCHRLIGEDYEVHVFAWRWDVEDPQISFHRVRTLPFPKSLRLLTFAIRATKAMEKGSYDILFGVGNTLRANILQPHGGVHWAWFWRSLRVYDHPLGWLIKLLGRIISPKQWVSGWIEDAPYRQSTLSAVIAISKMVKEDMIRWYQVPEKKITIIYNGVDVEHFHPRNRQYREEIRKRHGIFEEEWVILFVSNNFRMKGLDFLIRALAEIAKREPLPFKLLILGRDRKEPYIQLGKKLDISERLIFAGSTDEPEKYYGAADLLVHPTFYDACSLTVLEALASGLPVITTRSNGASGIITQGQEGFVISDAREVQVLTEKILYFLNRDQIERASAAARQLAESYSLEKNWIGMKDIFEKHCQKEAITK